MKKIIFGFYIILIIGLTVIFMQKTKRTIKVPKIENEEGYYETLEKVKQGHASYSQLDNYIEMHNETITSGGLSFGKALMKAFKWGTIITGVILIIIIIRLEYIHLMFGR